MNNTTTEAPDGNVLRGLKYAVMIVVPLWAAVVGFLLWGVRPTLAIIVALAHWAGVA